MNMRKTKKNIVWLVSLIGAVLFLASCHGGNRNIAADDKADTLVFRYAKNITFVQHADFAEALIANPWQQGAILTRYELRRPLVHSAVFISSLASLLDELGCLQAVSGVCEPEYIANESIHEAIAAGDIVNLGSALTPTKERIIDLAPDAILLSPFENVSTYGNLDQLGIPLIPCADYMEASPLARAEWMRFYGRLFGQGERADSLFAAVEAAYRTLTEAPHDDNPSVFFDTRNGSAWYMPGGKSTLGQMVDDAGGRFIFADNDQSGSVPYAFEQVYERAREADIWLLRYSADHHMTLKELQSEYAPYGQFKAFQKGDVFGCNNAELLFFEEYPFHPERLLNDLVHIFHPEEAPTYALRYFHRL